MANYTSKYTDRKVTAAQYIAEQMCIRLAAKEKKKLNDHFWNDKEWSVFFKRQHTLANNLLKTYSEGAIIQGIKNVKWAYSLATKALVGAINAVDFIKGQEDLTDTPKELTQRNEERPKNLLDLI